MRRPKVTLNCTADSYASPEERIIEFSSEIGGGLVSFSQFEKRLQVSVYRVDKTVLVTINPDDVLTIGEVADLACVTLGTARTWTHRHASFPKPWKVAAGTYLYLRFDVLRWLEETGRKVPAN